MNIHTLTGIFYPKNKRYHLFILQPIFFILKVEDTTYLYSNKNLVTLKIEKSIIYIQIEIFFTEKSRNQLLTV